jgi:hypothetical protein
MTRRCVLTGGRHSLAFIVNEAKVAAADRTIDPAKANV